MTLNTSNMLSEADEKFAVAVLPAIVTNATILLLGIVCSSLVCYLYRRAFPLSVTNFYIITLSISDILNCSFGLATETVDLRHNYTFGQYSACKLLRVLIAFLTQMSAFIIVLIALERFRCVCQPFKTQITVKQAKVSFAVVSGVSAVSVIPFGFVYGSSSHVTGPDYSNVTCCGIADDFYGSTFTKFYFIFLIVVFYVTVSILIGVYSLIWRRILRQSQFKLAAFNRRRVLNPEEMELRTATSQRLSGDRTSNQDEANQAEMPAVERVKRLQSSTTRLMFFITLAFIFAYLPHIAIRVAESINGEQFENLTTPQSNVYHIFLRSTYLQSVFNFIIYTSCNDRFRRQLKLFLSVR